MIASMCGRFVLAMPFNLLAEWLEANFDEQIGLDYRPRWNIAPTSRILAMRSYDGERRIEEYRWGLIPNWSKDIPKFSTHNARVETISTKPTFRHAFASGQRVLIPADGYYEWQVLGEPSKPVKQPWYMTSKDQLHLAFAGIYEPWSAHGPGGVKINTCSVITTTPGPDIGEIHDRQPVVLSRDTWDTWLDPETSVDETRALLSPAEIGTFDLRKVGSAVGNSRSEGEQLIEPL